jgi:hypothetical protein
MERLEAEWMGIASRCPASRVVGCGPAEPVPLIADGLRQQGSALRADFFGTTEVVP